MRTRTRVDIKWKLLALSGERSPYRDKLGAITPGAFADLLMIDGDREKTFVLV